MQALLERLCTDRGADTRRKGLGCVPRRSLGIWRKIAFGLLVHSTERSRRDNTFELTEYPPQRLDSAGNAPGRWPEDR